MNFRPEIVHSDLGADFFDEVSAASFPQHILRYRNQRWAKRVGLDKLTDEAWLNHFGRFVPVAGSFEKPLALRYHGHQFRSYNPDLGDGRGFLFAQMRDLEDGRLLDLGTKGSGQTPWSRGGDGRLTLKGGVREVLATEMLEALGVDTSRTFSLIETGEELVRGDEPSPTRSAVMVRLSHSHIRIGSFQRQAALQRPDNLEQLMNHAIRHYMPHVWHDDRTRRTLAFLTQVAENVARTGAAWTAAGFVHGVLNTDNINVTGESFDYGPWRFLPSYDPAFTAAYFDTSGLYSFGRQPETLLWNLARLAESLLDFAQPDELEQALTGFWDVFQSALAVNFCRRLGVEPTDSSNGSESGLSLLRALIEFWTATQAPFEQVMFDLRGGATSCGRLTNSPIAELYSDPSFEPVAALLTENFRITGNANLDHAYFQRASPRTMLIDEVEAIWQPIAEADDWSLLHSALSEIADMRDAYRTTT
nr:YdiU family protein [Pararhizobium sp. IMCC3301]